MLMNKSMKTGNKELSFLKNASYNTIGVIVFNFCLWLTTLVVVRLSPDYSNAGIWQLAISVTNIFSAVAVFNIATFYVSDVSDKYLTSDYICAQLTACFLSFLICLVYSYFCGYKDTLFVAITVYMLCRAIEAFAGMLFGIEQRFKRMDYVGLSYTIRGILDLLGFTLCLFFTKSIVHAIIVMAITTLIVVLIVDIPISKKFSSFKFKSSFVRVKGVLNDSFPSVVSIVAFTAISTIPRQFLEKVYDIETVGYYSTVAAPIVVIQVALIGFFTPLLRDVSLQYKENNFIKLKSVGNKIIGVLTSVTIIALLLIKFGGKYLYGLIYGDEIKPYVYLAYYVVLSVALYTACWVVSSMLIIMRKTGIMMMTSLLSLLLASIVSEAVITRFYMNGVSITIIVAYLTYFVINTVFIVQSIISSKRTSC